MGLGIELWDSANYFSSKLSAESSEGDRRWCFSVYFPKRCEVVGRDEGVIFSKYRRLRSITIKYTRLACS